MKRPRAGHTLAQRDKITGYGEHCCWPDCLNPLDYDAPLCGRHLIAAWRITLDTSQARVAALITPAERAERVYHPKVSREQRDDFGTVYFIRLGEMVKIGWTSNLRQRLRQLPHEEVLGTIPGTVVEEQQCHAAWQHLRVTGEWFRSDPDLLDWVAKVCS